MVDTQVYMILKLCDKRDISSSGEACIEEIGIWINGNMLKLDKDKTELIILSLKQHVEKTDNLQIKVRSSYIKYSMFVRNLGLMLYNTLGMEKQVISICKSC